MDRDLNVDELLEDLAWVLQDPGRHTALQQGWSELQQGEVLRPLQSISLSTDSLRALAHQSTRRKKKT